MKYFSTTHIMTLLQLIENLQVSQEKMKQELTQLTSVHAFPTFGVWKMGVADGYLTLKHQSEDVLLEFSPMSNGWFKITIGDAPTKTIWSAFTNACPSQIDIPKDMTSFALPLDRVVTYDLKVAGCMMVIKTCSEATRQEKVLIESNSPRVRFVNKGGVCSVLFPVPS
jgi:Ni,Fe-hydrogenase III small subunit